MLERTVEIEGYRGGYENIDPSDDTHPTANRAWFDVLSVEQPFLTNDIKTNPEEKIITKNVVHFFHESDLGRTRLVRPIKDKVEYNEVTGKWVVKKLAQGNGAYIKKFPEQWNAFARGGKYLQAGTPIESLFRHDPTRADMYRRVYKVETIEQLSGLTEGDADNIGMGARDDRSRARRYIEQTKEAVHGEQAKAQVERLEKLAASQAKQIEDLSSKLTQLLQQQLEAAQSEEVEVEEVRRGRGRPRKENQAEA